MTSSQKKPSEILNRMRSVTLREKEGEGSPPAATEAEPASATPPPAPAAPVPGRLRKRVGPQRRTRPRATDPQETSQFATRWTCLESSTGSSSSSHLTRRSTPARSCACSCGSSRRTRSWPNGCRPNWGDKREPEMASEELLHYCTTPARPAALEQAGTYGFRSTPRRNSGVTSSGRSSSAILTRSFLLRSTPSTASW